jgi:hypothetical protein
MLLKRLKAKRLFCQVVNLSNQCVGPDVTKRRKDRATKQADSKAFSSVELWTSAINVSA